MRRSLPLLLAFAWLALVAASAPAKAVPSPSPSPSPSAPPPVFSQTPTVLIYPFDMQGGGDPKIGYAIAQILSQEMSGAGGIKVLPLPQRVARTDFLSNARQERADFYISGYVTPIGNAASVVEQVVSVDSGVILFSQTAQVSSVADVASQALQARSQILAFTNRGTQTLGAQSANTPAPTATNGAQVKVSGLSAMVDSVFHRRGGPAPTPAPVTKPSRGVIVAPITGAGSVASADLTNATNELYFAMARKYNAAMTAIKGNVAQAADSICGAHRDNTIATGTLAENIPKHGREVDFTLQVYTCFGVVLATQTGKGNTLKAAVDSAVAAYATAHPDNS